MSFERRPRCTEDLTLERDPAWNLSMKYHQYGLFIPGGVADEGERGIRTHSFLNIVSIALSLLERKDPFIYMSSRGSSDMFE